MRRVILVVGLVAGFLFLTPTAAIACSCADIGVAAQVRNADTIVDATLEWATTNGIERSYGIKVAEVYKGKAATQEKLRTPADEAACGLGNLATEERYLFFISGEHPGQLRVGLCGGSAEWTPELAEQVRAVTGPPTGPYVAPPEKPGPKDDDQIVGTSVWTVIGTGAVLAAVIGGLVLLRRRV